MHRKFVVGTHAWAESALPCERTWAYQTKSAFSDSIILAFGSVPHQFVRSTPCRWKWWRSAKPSAQRSCAWYGHRCPLARARFRRSPPLQRRGLLKGRNWCDTSFSKIAKNGCLCATGARQPNTRHQAALARSASVSPTSVGFSANWRVLTRTFAAIGTLP